MRAVARRIAEVRRLAGITQEALAEQLGIALKNVQRIESGRQNLTLQTLARVATALGVAPPSLIADVSAKAPQLGPRAARAPRAPFTRVADGARSGAMPLMTLRAACGAFGDGDEVEVAEWVVPNTRRRIGQATGFVAQVTGTSMEPLIPDGAFVLFRAPVRGPLVGRVLLVQMRDASDPETGGAYIVKRIADIRRTRGGASRVRLVSENPEHKPLTLTLDDSADVRFVAEVVDVLST